MIDKNSRPTGYTRYPVGLLFTRDLYLCVKSNVITCSQHGDKDTHAHINHLPGAYRRVFKPVFKIIAFFQTNDLSVLYFIVDANFLTHFMVLLLSCCWFHFFY